jgi:hypothetical protein
METSPLENGNCTLVPNPKDPKLEKEYNIAVRLHSVFATDIPKTLEEKKAMKVRRLIGLACGEFIDCDDFISEEIMKNDNGFRRKIHPDHFGANCEISDKMSLNRCTYLRLSNPAKYIEFARDERKKDRNQSLDMMKDIVDHIFQRESDYRKVRWGDDSSQQIINASHLGKKLSQCKTLEEARPIFEVCYTSTKELGKCFHRKMANAAMKRMKVTYDEDAMANRGILQPCYHNIASNIVNDIRKQISRYGERGQYGIVINMKGPRKLSPEEHALKRSKGVSIHYYLSRELKVESLTNIFYRNKLKQNEKLRKNIFQKKQSKIWMMV